MNRRRIIRWLLIFCGVLFTVPCCILSLRVAAEGGSDRGSPALAAEWRRHLEQFPDPDTAKAADPLVLVLRCPNGEWVFGRTQSSHGMWLRGGGTVVIRDSTGHTRVFFGHVCGPGDLGLFGEKPSSLDEFYKELDILNLKEHRLE